MQILVLFEFIVLYELLYKPDLVLLVVRAQNTLQSMAQLVNFLLLKILLSRWHIRVS